MTDFDRLDGRSRPTATYKLLIDHDLVEDAHRKLQHAQTALRMALITGETEDRLDGLRRDEEAALAEVEACFEPITFTALPPEQFEALADAHKPRTGTKDEAWNIDTFPKVCFLACAPGPWTTEKWEEWLKSKVSEGEQIKLFNTAIKANVRVLDPTLPKDSTETLD